MKLAPRASALLALCLMAGAATAQVSLTGPAYTQDFDSLANSGSGHTALPAGWLLNESGTNANGQYQAGTGSGNSGDSYSFGASGSTERALGGLLSGSLSPSFGACFTNNVGNEVTALDIAYTGEQWRSGSAGRLDTINFQYSLDATSLADGSWVDVDALDFVTPNTVGTGAKDGNDAANRTPLSSQIAGLAIANGSGFCIRWTDFNASGADDGLAVDDFSLTPVFVAPGADVAATISVDPGPVVPGGTITVRTTVRNDSAVTSDPYSYTARYLGEFNYNPGSAGFTGFSGSHGVSGGNFSYAYGNASLTFNSTGAGAGSSISTAAAFTIDAGAQGPLLFSSAFTGLDSDPDQSNNSPLLVVALDGQESDIAVSLADSVDPAVPGSSVTYTATVSNNGPGRAYGMRLSLPLPVNTTYVGSTFDPALFDACEVQAGVLECTGAQFVNSGASGDVTLEVLVDAGFLGNLSTTATAASLVPDLVAGNDTDTETTLVEIPRLAIHAVQGAGLQSPVNGQLVEIEGIVTAQRFNNAFFVQTVPGSEDANPATSEGIMVFTGSAPPASAAVGNRVIVSGTVEEYRSSSNPHQGFVTEIINPTVSVVSSGNALPAPVEITAAMMDPSLPPESLEYLEAMRVSVGRLVATAPTEGSLDENDALAFPNGNFWGVVEGIERPFREPGVGVQDVGPALPANTPRFDTNPERLRVQSRGQIGADPIVLDTGAIVTGLVGVLDYGFGTYILMPDPDAVVVVEGGAGPRAVPDPAIDEFTIAGANMLRFYDEVNDAGGDVALTPAAFERRLAKAALAICNYMKAPEIIGVVEVENLRALSMLADRVNSTCALGPQYAAYLEEGNDVGKINVGFLVDTTEVGPGIPRVQVVSVTQYGKDAVISNPSGTTSTMHDRPPLVLRALVNAGNGASSPVTVIGNHLLSLIDINDNDPGSNGYASNGERRRVKRAEQAAFTAALVEQFQQANPAERIVLLGDFNAFEFSDGYVDVMGIITGREAANDAVLEYRDSPVTVPLTNMTTLSAPEDRYSFSFEGNAQVLDHMVVNQALLDSAPVRIEHARINADFGIDNFGDETLALRSSDHDPVVLYVGDVAFVSTDLAISAVAPASAIAGDDIPMQVTVSNPGPDAATDVLVSLVLDAELPALAVTAPAGFACGPATVAAGETTVDCAIAEMAPGSVVFDLVATTALDTVIPATGLTLTARVQTTRTDGNMANNLATATVQVAPPTANLALYVAELPPLNRPQREGVVGIMVRNFGPDAAPGTWFEFTVSTSLYQVLPEPPAGWNCALSATYRASQVFRCEFAGRYGSRQADVLKFRVKALRSTTAAFQAKAGSAAIDLNLRNNETQGSFRVGIGY